MEDLEELLPQQPNAADAAGVNGTFRSSVVTLSAWAMGCGVLALPRVFAACGAIRGLALLALFAYWVDLSLRWTVACGRYSGQRSFAGNAQFYLGTGGAWIVRAAQTVLLFGGIVSTFVVVASLLPCIARDLLEIACAGGQDAVEQQTVPLDAGSKTEEFLAAVAVSDTSSSGTRISRSLWSMVIASVCWAHPMPCMPRDSLLIWVGVIVLPLACQGSLHALRKFSSLGLACLVYFFVALLVRFALVSLSTMDSEADVNGRAPMHPLLLSGNPEVAGDFWQGPPILLMAFLCHTSILRLDEELRPASKSEVGEVIHTVVLRIALPVYAFVGLGGVFLCGPNVSSNILEDFQGDALMAAARLTLGLLNIVKIPLGVVALREDLVGALPWPSVRRRFSSGAGQFAFTAALLAVALLSASAAGSLSRVLSLMGCTVGVLFSLCLPAALYWRLVDRLAQAHGAAATSSATSPGGNALKPLRRPLLGNVGSPRTAAAFARVAGAVVLPRDAAERLRHRAASFTVFFGGITVGWLGLAAWLEREAAR